MLTVTLDTGELRSRLVSFSASLQGGLDDALGDVAQESLERIAGGFYWTNRTGRTASSFSVRRSGQLRYRLSSSSPIAGYLDKGTKAHVIEAKGKSLRFVANGNVRFARRVMHPGTKALGFEQREAAQAEGILPDRFERVADKVISSAGLGLWASSSVASPTRSSRRPRRSRLSA
jgi:hypothetical protein